MAEAYAALVSLLHILNNIQASHLKFITENPWIKDLKERATFLKEFLKGCSRRGGRDEDTTAAQWESRVAAAACAAEDALECHVADRLYLMYSEEYGTIPEEYGLINLDQCLEEVIKDMDRIIHDGEVEQIYKFTETALNSSENVESSTRNTKNSENENLVGFDHYLIQLKDKLTGQGAKLLFIPISGMGGIGKTSLAKTVYVDPLIKDRFDIRAWATVSQEYSAQKILLCLLQEIGVSMEQESSTAILGDKLHKELFGRRYLIILDDMWSVEALNQVKLCFPENNEGSRIIVTTRLSIDMFMDFHCWGLKIEFLNKESSWSLLEKKVFGDSGLQDSGLDELGKMIASKCKGLPLSIITIAGLLSKSHTTPEYWNYVLQNLNSIIASNDDDYCLQILYLSYQHLPLQLKPCFLYMGVFPEDEKIRVTKLIKLWVSEGFLEPGRDKSLEEVAYDCLKGLIDRNLVFLNDKTQSGKMKTCYVHDVLRSLCLEECRREKFLFVPNVIRSKESRRFAIHQGRVENLTKESQPASLVRTLSVHDSFHMQQFSSPMYRLLRVVGYIQSEGNEIFWRHVNLKYLELKLNRASEIPSFIKLLWNIETLHVHMGSRYGPIVLPNEIWGMPHLKHLIFEPFALLPEPHLSRNNLTLERLVTISTLMNFKITEEVIQRIPKVKKLKICWSSEEKLRREDKDKLDSCVFENLGRLIELESLSLSLCLQRDNWVQDKTIIQFPPFLKKLIMQGGKLPWESMTRIGSLPNLEMLRLGSDSFIGTEWNTKEGEFRSVKFLEIDDCRLERWNADATCFPRLEHLVIKNMQSLEEIPPDFMDIDTLQSISLDKCSPLLNRSALEILEQRTENGDESFQVRIQGNKHRHMVTDAVTYAAVISLLYTIENIQQHRHFSQLDYNPLLDILRTRATFLQYFLEHYTSSQVEMLESQIAAAAHAAEDILESHIVDQIRNVYFSSVHDENSSIQHVTEGLQKVIDDMETLEKIIKEKKETRYPGEQPIDTTVFLPSKDETAVDLVGFDEDACILNSSSYIQLPIHLKPCFLYMRVFPEGYEIRVSMLVRLWIAEGFIQTEGHKSLEETAEEYLHNLIDKKLIMVKSWGSSCKVKTCIVHDEVKEFFFREMRGDKFLFSIKQCDEGMKSMRQVIFQYDPKRHYIRALESASFIRSITCNFSPDLPLENLKLLRVLNYLNGHIQDQENELLLFNSRYLHISGIKAVPSSISLLWNIQTLYIDTERNNVITLPVQIWEMGTLKHLIVSPCTAILPDPPCDNTHVELWKLQTVSTLMNFKCSEEMARRMPSLKKLKVVFDELEIEDSSDCGVNNLCLLQKLESLSLSLSEGGLLRLGAQWEKRYVFPRTLKKLYLSGCGFPWESMKMIGRLPNLEVLKLWNDAFSGDTWKVCEEEFHSLKTLQIAHNHSLKY